MQDPRGSGPVSRFSFLTCRSLTQTSPCSLPPDERRALLWHHHVTRNCSILWLGCFPTRVRVRCDGCASFATAGRGVPGSRLSHAVRPILIDDPTFIFPLSLQQVTVYRSMQGTTELHQERARQQMKVGSSYLHSWDADPEPQVFWLVLLGIFVWQFFPECQSFDLGASS